LKARGIRGGILLRFDAGDDPTSVEHDLAQLTHLLDGKVSIEVADRLDPALLDVARKAIDAAGGSLKDLRPAGHASEPQRGETLVIGRTVRSGARIESTASVVVIGDVNAGAEILAADDIIVLGHLRGLAHAGAAGNEQAVIWAQRIESQQLRIGRAVAQGNGASDELRSSPELAMLKDGSIVLRPWQS